MSGPTTPPTYLPGAPGARIARRRRWSAAIGLAGAVLLAGACSDGSGSGPTTTSAAATDVTTSSTASSVAAADTSGLTGTGWKLTGLLSDGTSTAVDPTLNGWVRFAPAADGLQVAFNTTCNRGGGSATVAGDEITFGPQRVTLIYCDGPSGSTETAMLALFAGPRTFTLDGPAGTLAITSTDGASGLSFTADQSVGADAFTDAPGATGAATTSASG